MSLSSPENHGRNSISKDRPLSRPSKRNFFDTIGNIGKGLVNTILPGAIPDDKAAQKAKAQADQAKQQAELDAK